MTRDDARDFLKGKSQDIQQKIAADMQAASDVLDYELAAAIRDKIHEMKRMQVRLKGRKKL